MRRRIEIGAVLVALCGCVDAGGGPTPTPAARQAATDSALTAEEAVEEVTDVLGDVGGFVGNGFAGFGAGGGQGWQDWLDGGGLPAFEPPANCTIDASFLGGDVSIASDCTMPSGRRVEGSLHIGLDTACAPFGFSVAFDLLTESAPGANDEVRVTGSVDLSFADARLYLAVRLSEETRFATVHATDIAACLVVDLPARLLALDGSVVHSVDGQERHALRIQDLQASICEHPPYTGVVQMSGPVHNVTVSFERPSPDEARIAVHADGTTTRVELPVLRLPGPLCADLPPVPLELDYASCGGCGHPDPAPPIDEDDAGDGAGGADPEAPLPGGDPDDALD